MRKTDYSSIAGRYDNNKFRNIIEPDFDLKDYIDHAAKDQIRVLDLACGTGLYLKNQLPYFENKKIEWYGLDAFSEMLEKAKSKVDGVSFVKGLAENLPYDDCWFDFIINNYAFHHFPKKSDALNEVNRVLAKDGVFKIHNIAIHEMPKWWIYQYFPSAYYEDLKRFWQKELIYNELLHRGFEVTMRLEYKMEETRLSELIEYVYNRDISILTLVSDEEYQDSMERMAYQLKKDPDAKIISDFAEIYIIAKKR